MADLNPFPYLSDDTLDACIRSLKVARNDACFLADRETREDQLEARLQAYIDVSRLYLTAVAERTARLALTPELRFRLMQEAKR